MRIAINTLEGAALDYAVALCEGGGSLWFDTICTHWVKIDGKDRALSKGWQSHSYSPSTNWSQGGPIIDGEGIDLYCNVPTNPSKEDPAWRGSWRAKYHRCGYGTEMFYGPTALIAAMRCHVASKLGDEVEIPDSLLRANT